MSYGLRCCDGDGCHLPDCVNYGKTLDSPEKQRVKQLQFSEQAQRIAGPTPDLTATIETLRRALETTPCTCTRQKLLQCPTCGNTDISSGVDQYDGSWTCGRCPREISPSSFPKKTTHECQRCAALTNPAVQAVAEEWERLRQRAERAEAEVARLKDLGNISRFESPEHRPSYAALCLYEGEISLAKYCEWVRAYASGQDEGLPEGVLRSGGFEHTPKELLERAERAEAERERWKADWELMRDFEMKVRDSAAELLALLSDKFPDAPKDGMTLYCLSLIAGISEQWVRGGVVNGIEQAIDIPNVGMVVLSLQKVDGEPLARLLQKAEAERDQAGKEFRSLWQEATKYKAERDAALKKLAGAREALLACERSFNAEESEATSFSTDFELSLDAREKVAYALGVARKEVV